MALLRLRLLAIETAILPATTVRCSFRHHNWRRHFQFFRISNVISSFVRIAAFSFPRVAAAKNVLRRRVRARFRNRTRDRRSVIFLSLYAGLTPSFLGSVRFIASPRPSSSYTVAARTSRMRSSILIERRKTTTTSWKPQGRCSEKHFPERAFLSLVGVRVLTVAFPISSILTFLDSRDFFLADFSRACRHTWQISAAKNWRRCGCCK